MKGITAYSVVSFDYSPGYPFDTSCIGTFLSVGKAITECADYIIDRLDVRDDIRMALYYDENHKGLREILEMAAERAGAENPEETVRSLFVYSPSDADSKGNASGAELEPLIFPRYSVPWEMNDVTLYVRSALKKYIIRELSDQFVYIARKGDNVFRFEIFENEIEGTATLWTCVTSGSSDSGDEEFEQKFPKLHLTKESAVKNALDDLGDLLVLCGSDERRRSDVIRSARENLSKFGWFRYHIDDKKVRRWDIWRTPIKMGG